MAYRGDLIACEVDFDDIRNSTVPIVFSKNGREVARASMQYITGRTNLFPYISLGYEGIRVLAKMCPRDSSGLTQYSSASEQRLNRDPGKEHELLYDVRNQNDILIENMRYMEMERKEKALQFQEQLEDQRKMLTDIRDLVLVLIRERQKDKTAADDNVQFA